MAREGKASRGDRQLAGHEHLSWTERDTSTQHWPFASVVSPAAAGGPGDASLAGERVARWLQHKCLHFFPSPRLDAAH